MSVSYNRLYSPEASLYHQEVEKPPDGYVVVKRRYLKTVLEFRNSDFRNHNFHKIVSNVRHFFAERTQLPASRAEYEDFLGRTPVQKNFWISAPVPEAPQKNVRNGRRAESQEARVVRPNTVNADGEMNYDPSCCSGYTDFPLNLTVTSCS